MLELLTILSFRYHVPRSWLKLTQNLLVLFEELGGDPTRITLVKRSVASVCADVTEYHPNIKNWHIESYGKTQEFHRPKVHLKCSPGQSISSIKFASFGTPLGTCGSFQQGTCHAPSSYAILEKVLFLYSLLFSSFTTIYNNANICTQHKSTQYAINLCVLILA